MMLSGNVQVSVQHHDLIVRGDDFDNGIAITQTGPGSYLVTGIPYGTADSSGTNLTKVQGGASFAVTGVTSDIKVSLKGGRDFLSIGALLPVVAAGPPPTVSSFTVTTPLTVPHNLAVDMGKGDDAVLLPEVTVGHHAKIEGSWGNDLVGMVALGVGHALNVETNSGDDTVVASLNSTTLSTAGADYAAGNSAFAALLTPLGTALTTLLGALPADAVSFSARHAEISTGSGNDSATVATAHTDKYLKVELGHGNDTLNWADNTYGNAILDGGPGSDTLNTPTATTNGKFGNLRIRHFDAFFGGFTG
jgi:hypothetical protein